MAKIIYAVSGEGRGHATRARALLENLQGRHEVVLCASGQAYDLLSMCGDADVRRLPGLAFRYSGSRLSYLGTGKTAFDFLLALRRYVGDAECILEEIAPDLVIADFEPLVSRAAKRLGLPLMSLDHQHFLTDYDLGELPLKLRLWSKSVAPFIHAVCRGQDRTVVSAFFFPPPKNAPPKNGPSAKNAIEQIGVLLRPEIVRATPEDRGHLVAYLRRFGHPRVLDALAASGVEARIYGLGEQPNRGNLRFHAIDPHRFVEDLAASRALVTTAGNQLVGESLYLGKPVFAMPEPGNYEQEINAFYVEAEGGGRSYAMDDVRKEDLRNFLDEFGAGELPVDRERLHGNPAAIDAIERHLQSSQLPHEQASDKGTATQGKSNVSRTLLPSQRMA